MLVEYRKYRTAWQINTDWCFLAAQKIFGKSFLMISVIAYVVVWKQTYKKEFDFSQEDRLW